MHDHPYAIIISQHAEEAAFLWRLRDLAARSPQYSMAELLDLDDRVDAHLDGLRLADDGWDVALEQLEAHPGPGETFACGFLAFAGGNQARIARVLKSATEPANARGVVSALGWLADDRQAADHAIQLGLSDDPVARRIGVATSAIRRIPVGPVVQRGLTDKDPGVQARAARAVGELGATTLVGMLRLLLGAADLATRFWAAWSLALLAGDSSALAELRTVALTEHKFRYRAVDLVARRGDVRANAKWLSALEATPDGSRLVIHGLRALGDPDAVPRLLEWMKDPALARVAAEAFAFITGVHISYDKLEAAPPEGFQSGPTEDPADEDVALDPDGNLDWPDPVKCAAWWTANKTRFTSGTRYLCGRPINSDHLRDVIRTRYQRQRAAAALELAIREPGKPLYEVRAPGFRQRV